MKRQYNLVGIGTTLAILQDVDTHVKIELPVYAMRQYLHLIVPIFNPSK